MLSLGKGQMINNKNETADRMKLVPSACAVGYILRRLYENKVWDNKRYILQ